MGYILLGFEWKGMSWHTQHCHNAADSDEGKNIDFNELGLISKWEDASRLAEWYMDDGSHVEPVFWLPFSVHAVVWQ